MKTYRFRGHSRTDPAKYRPDGELERWRERDPITLFGRYLQEAGHASGEELQAMRAEAQVAVDAAAASAAESPFPTLEEIEAYVYAS
jgi:pyruvate dehydrogenase E1 component alpha subunit